MERDLKANKHFVVAFKPTLLLLSFVHSHSTAFPHFCLKGGGGIRGIVNLGASKSARHKMRIEESEAANSMAAAEKLSGGETYRRATKKKYKRCW